MVVIAGPTEVALAAVTVVVAVVAPEAAAVSVVVTVVDAVAGAAEDDVAVVDDSAVRSSRFFSAGEMQKSRLKTMASKRS